MSTRYTLIIAFILSSFWIQAQEFAIFEVGPSYVNQAFYSFSSNEASTVTNESWDLAFSAWGDTDATIYLNESLWLGIGQPPQAPVRLFLAPTRDFDDVIDPGMITTELQNDEIDWNTGAGNSTRDVQNVNDYGWGELDPMTGVINGTNVFVLQTRSGAMLKLFVETLENGMYTIRHADLDGSNEDTLRIQKSAFAGQSLAFYSFDDGQFVNDQIDAGWDLFFGRYTTDIDNGIGGTFPLTVTGTLSGEGTTVAEVRGMDPFMIEFDDYQDSLKSRMDIIGHDWKDFDNYAWVIPSDLSYFVKTRNDHLYHVIFIDFGGSSSGEIIFEYFDLGVFTSTQDVQPSEISAFEVFPTLTSASVQLVFELKEKAKTTIEVVDMNGVLHRSFTTSFASGLHARTLSLQQLPAGMYAVQMRTENGVVARRVVVE